MLQEQKRDNNGSIIQGNGVENIFNVKHYKQT